MTARGLSRRSKGSTTRVVYSCSLKGLRHKRQRVHNWTVTTPVYTTWNTFRREYLNATTKLEVVLIT